MRSQRRVGFESEVPVTGRSVAVKYRVTRHNTPQNRTSKKGHSRQQHSSARTAEPVNAGQAGVVESPKLAALYHELGLDGKRRAAPRRSAAPTASETPKPAQRSVSPRGAGSKAAAKAQLGGHRAARLRQAYAQVKSSAATLPGKAEASKYVHNLQQQIYFLELESQLLKDQLRGGKSVPSNNGSPRSSHSLCSPAHSPRSPTAAMAPPVPATLRVVPAAAATPSSPTPPAHQLQETEPAIAVFASTATAQVTPGFDSVAAVDSTLMAIHSKYAALEGRWRSDMAHAASEVAARDSQIHALRSLVARLKQELSEEVGRSSSCEQQYDANLETAIKARNAAVSEAKAAREAATQSGLHSERALQQLVDEGRELKGQLQRAQDELVTRDQDLRAGQQVRLQLCQQLQEAEDKLEASGRTVNEMSTKLRAAEEHAHKGWQLYASEQVARERAEQALAAAEAGKSALLAQAGKLAEDSQRRETKIRDLEHSLVVAEQALTHANERLQHTDEVEQALRHETTQHGLEAAEAAAKFAEARACIEQLRNPEVEAVTVSDESSVVATVAHDATSDARVAELEAQLSTVVARLEVVDQALTRRDATIGALRDRLTSLHDQLADADRRAATAVQQQGPSTSGLDLSSLEGLDVRQLRDVNLRVASAIEYVLQQRAAQQPSNGGPDTGEASEPSGAQ